MSSKQILVLTGDITHCEKLKQNLEAEGYTVDIAYRGDEAINILKRKWVDLIITSYYLAGGNEWYPLFTGNQKK
jgi:DNA-binding response OmpR family regulator